MGEEKFVDLEILSKTDDGYVVLIDNNSLDTLVKFDECLTVRHWDGEKPVILESLDIAAKCRNNIDNLGISGVVNVDGLLEWLAGQRKS